MVFGGRFRIKRCNSKASYLPRQTLERLNSLDPDHGSYKLTLTSNEDFIDSTNSPSQSCELLPSHSQTAANLPDVLPLGAKLHSQSSSSAVCSASPLQYGSSGNISDQQQPLHSSAYKPLNSSQHRYSTSAISSSYTNNNNSEINCTKTYTRSQSFEVTSSTNQISQTKNDHKKNQNLEPAIEEAFHETVKMPPCAQTRINFSTPTRNSGTSGPLRTLSSPPSGGGNFGSKTFAQEGSNVGDTSEGRIVRAELATATLTTSACSDSNKPITRKGSLRENIEKITQLQSKLMSAHISDLNFITAYGPKTPTKSTTPTNDQKPQIVDNATDELQEKMSDCHPLPGCKKDEQVSDLAKDCEAMKISETSESSCPLAMKTPNTNLSERPSSNIEAVVVAQIAQMDANIDGLKLLQRSELILQVNPNTIEVASQTDDMSENDSASRLTIYQNRDDEVPSNMSSSATLEPRKPHPIEMDCEKISKELADFLSPNHKLINILAPVTLKSTGDYIGSLYNPNVPVRSMKRDVGTSTLMRMKGESESGGKITVELQYAEVEMLLPTDGETECCDLMKSKVDELISTLNRKIHVLCKERSVIMEESAINDELGCNLLSKLTNKLRPIETTKLRTYIDDVGHITSLLLSLSERLAKIDNKLNDLLESNAEKKILESKRDRLLEQLGEAKRLKEDIDRRGCSAVSTLKKNLSADDFADFNYFINMKAKLIVDVRCVADKIKSGEEQLNALSEALIQSDC